MAKTGVIAKAAIILTLLAVAGVIGFLWMIFGSRSLENPRSQAQLVMSPLVGPWPIAFDRVKAIADSGFRANQHVYFEFKFVGLDQKRAAAFLDERLRESFGAPDQPRQQFSSPPTWTRRSANQFEIDSPSYAPLWWPDKKSIDGQVVVFSYGGSETSTKLQVLKDGRVFGYHFLAD